MQSPPIFYAFYCLPSSRKQRPRRHRENQWWGISVWLLDTSRYRRRRWVWFTLKVFCKGFSSVFCIHIPLTSDLWSHPTLFFNLPVQNPYRYLHRNAWPSHKTKIQQDKFDQMWNKLILFITTWQQIFMMPLVLHFYQVTDLISVWLLWPVFSFVCLFTLQSDCSSHDWDQSSEALSTSNWCVHTEFTWAHFNQNL